MNKLLLFAVFSLALVGTSTFESCRAGATYWVTNTGDSGPGSLRQAITDANACTGIDTIAFNIPGAGVQTVQPGSALPTVADTVVIDGYTQPGASPATSSEPAVLLISLDGTTTPGLVDGLDIMAGGCTVRGVSIGGFSGNGVALRSNGGNSIVGNWIGFAGQSGVLIECNDNLIGGVEPGDPNTIGGNGLDGVRIVSGIRNAVLSNSISGNFLLGIDLGGDGVTENDPGDTDTGANNLQNSPQVDYAAIPPASSVPVVSGCLFSSPSTTYRLEFFRTWWEPNGLCEGKKFWGSINEMTDASGFAYFAAEMPELQPLYGGHVTATATDLSTNVNDTSEFSEAVGIIYPVELSSFTGVSDQETIRLEWTTLSESENLGFHLYRSDSEDVAYSRTTNEMIPGAGTTLAEQNYSYVDADVEVGATYSYQLADVDFEGVETIHGPVRVTVLPCEYRLRQNFPNPFRENTTITLNLKASGHGRLVVHNLAGDQVAVLLDGPMERGVHKIAWEGRNSTGHDLPSGTYTYTFEVNEFRSSRQMTLNR